MKSRAENEFWFAYTVAPDGHVIPFSVAPVHLVSRECVAADVRRCMRRKGCDGGVARLTFEMEASKFQAQMWCDAEPGVPPEVGCAFFETMLERLPIRGNLRIATGRAAA